MKCHSFQEAGLGVEEELGCVGRVDVEEEVVAIMESYVMNSIAILTAVEAVNIAVVEYPLCWNSDSQPKE
jgi:hypothetical protein